MNSDPPDPYKKHDHLLEIIGAVAGALVVVIAQPSGPLMTLWHGAMGAFVGYMTVKMRTIAEGWQGWVGAICFWWAVPLLFYFFDKD